jgi:hypothetical protein
MHGKKIRKNGKNCSGSCCQPPSFGGDSVYCGFITTDENSKDSNIVDQPGTSQIPTTTGSKVPDQKEQAVDKEKSNNDKKDNIENNININIETKTETNHVQSSKSEKSNGTAKLVPLDAGLAPKGNGHDHIKLNDVNYCTDANCSECEGNHDSTIRNTFLGIAGILILAMIGYLSYIKIKSRRSKALESLS